MPRMVFPQYKRGRNGIECGEGTILDHARRLGVQLPSECGGRGQCRRCVVRIDRGVEALSEKTAAERAAGDAGDASDHEPACRRRLGMGGRQERQQPLRLEPLAVGLGGGEAVRLPRAAAGL